MKRSSNPCESCRESICLFAGNALSDAERAAVQRHLAECEDCRKYYEQIRSVAVPLAAWERSFARVQPDREVQTRWRNAVLGAADPQPIPRFSFRLALRTCWRELVRPSRHAWAAMAALWLVMWGINAAMSGAPRTVPSARSSTPANLFQAFEEQRGVLAELIPPAINEPAVEPPRRDYSRPRSEWRMLWSLG